MNEQPAVRFAAIRETAARREHGSRARYVTGCRCLPCRAANSRYQSERLAAQKVGESGRIVPADAARTHILMLSKQGIGRRAVAEEARVNGTTLVRVKNGEKTQIRRSTERRILAVGADAISDGGLVPAGPTWARIKRLLKDGYSKAQLAKWFGYSTPALQLKTDRIKSANAYRIQRLCDEIEVGHFRRGV